MQMLPEFTEIEWLPCERNTKLNHFEQCVLQVKLALGSREYCQSWCTVLLKIKGSCMCSMIGV